MNNSAQARYHALESDREQFLSEGRRCAALTLPYLLTPDGLEQGGDLPTPYQSVGAKGVNVLSAKLLLSLLPINTTFFKLQISDAELAGMPELDPAVRSDIDLSLSKMERIVMQQIAETSDRVQINNALRHLVVTGNCLLYAGKKSLKVFPLDRYVISRDGEGHVVEMITKEVVDRNLLPKGFQSVTPPNDSNSPGEDGPKFGVVSRTNKGKADDAVVYTHVTVRDGQHRWHQECDGRIIPGSKSNSPAKSTPWMPLRFNVAGNGEAYGRGRVEEFYGDLVSLESLMKAMVEGSAAAAKCVFLVSPSATTKPQSLASAASGSIIQGRAEDVSVVSVGKTADFKTVQEMINSLTQRLADAFLVLQVRHSDRTTASEVMAVQQELNEQLGGIFSGLSQELLLPYLHRKLHLLARSKKVPTLPKGLVLPTVVAGIGNVGRGQDKQALMEFVGTLAQAMGPEALAQYINPQEFIKRLAAASGIESLNLVKTEQELQAETQQAQQQAMQASVVNQMGQLAKSPIGEEMTKQFTQSNDGTNQEAPPPSPQG
jgi:hypothetical protein